MKDERKIVIKTEQLKRIRNNLRRILIKAVYDEIEILRNYASLYSSPNELPPEEEVELYYLQGTKHELSSLISKSICECPICSSQDKDMVYIDFHKEWYCVECYENDRIWYPVHGSSENRWQNDYINMYYEQKENFEKKYLNRTKRDPDE